jgi:hypothetical protein
MRQADDELGRISLRAKESIEDQASDQASRLPSPDPQPSRDRAAQECGWLALTGRRPAQRRNDLMQRPPPHQESHASRGEPDTPQQGDPSEV